MGLTNDRLVKLIRGNYGSIAAAAREVGISPAAMYNSINKSSSRRNLLKYLPDIHKHTGVPVMEIYDAIMDNCE